MSGPESSTSRAADPTRNMKHRRTSPTNARTPEIKFIHIDYTHKQECNRQQGKHLGGSQEEQRQRHPCVHPGVRLHNTHTGTVFRDRWGSRHRKLPNATASIRPKHHKTTPEWLPCAEAPAALPSSAPPAHPSQTGIVVRRSGQSRERGVVEKYRKAGETNPRERSGARVR
jgi:hypothetical protein